MSMKTLFQEGMKERKRKKSLGKVNTEFKEKGKTLTVQLTALGQKAWETKADLSAYPELQAALADTQKILDDLRAQAQQLQKQKQSDEAEKKRENERLNAAIREAEEKKRTVDSRLKAQREALQDAFKETQKAISRLSAIAAERSQLQNKGADPATSVDEKNEMDKGLERLAAEEAELKTANTARLTAEKPVAAQVAALQEDSAQAQKLLEGLRGELKKTMGDMEKRIASLSADLAKNGEKAKEAEGRQKLNLQVLGEKLSAAQGVRPDIAKEMAAVLNARTEMEGVQALIGGLERQKDEGQVSAYKKMLAILIGGIVLVVAIVIALILLLSPRKKATPLEGLLGSGAAAQNLGELAQRMEKGLGSLGSLGSPGNIKAESEKIQGGKIHVSSEGILKSALPAVGGWQAQDPYYSKGAYNDLEIASLQADYSGSGGDAVRFQVTDTGTASALLAPLKMVFSMNIRVGDQDVMQQTSTVNGIPVVERIDKRDGEATFGIVYKDRYLIELKTKSARGLELLREFAAKLDLSGLPS